MPFIRPILNLGYTQPDRPGGLTDLAQLIDFNAVHNPDHVWCRQMHADAREPGRDITCAQLAAAVERCAAWLVGSGATEARVAGQARPAPVALFCSSDATLYIFMAALIRLGTPSLLLSARLTGPAIGHLVAQTGAQSLIYNQQTQQRVSEAKEAHEKGMAIRTLASPSLADFLEPHFDLNGGFVATPRFEYQDRHERGMVILHSSGTTGMPKAIEHGPSMHLVYAACHCDLPQGDEHVRYNISTLPLYHGFGLLAVGLALSVGMPAVLASAATIPTARWVMNATQKTAARYLMTIPSILEDMHSDSGLDALPILQQFDLVAVGGAPMKPSLAQELRQEGVNLLNHIGATEVGAIGLIRPIPPQYDVRYLLVREDLDIEFRANDDDDGSFRLVAHPRGWPDEFVVADAFERHPSLPMWRVLRRTDELIVLENGEKVGPGHAEAILREHPMVKEAMMFGHQRPYVGVLVEVHPLASAGGEDNDDWQARLRSELTPYLKRVNDNADGHARVAPDMLVFTLASQAPLQRTDKGSIARKENVQLFRQLIDGAYTRQEEAVSQGCCALAVDDEARLIMQLTEMVARCSNVLLKQAAHGIDDDDDNITRLDFFEAGMDSLQARKLFGLLRGSIRVTKALDMKKATLPQDLIYQVPTIQGLANLLYSMARGGKEGPSHDLLSMQKRKVEEMHRMLARHVASLEQLKRHVDQATVTQASSPVETNELVPAEEVPMVVLLTGATGSLGAQLLQQLAEDPLVSKVYCPVRAKVGTKGEDDDGQKILRAALQDRQIVIEDKVWNDGKIHGFVGQLGMAGLGADADIAEQLLSVTHVLHVAWPMDFNRKLASFDQQAAAVVNLAALCLAAAQHRQGSRPRRFLMASSIGAVGKYGEVFPGSKGRVPEERVPPDATNDFGYGEAKWVCEELTLLLNHYFPSLLQGSIARLGQLTGPGSTGAWSTREHFPAIIQTSALIRALPNLQGTFSWIPVDRTAKVMRELLISSSFSPIWHVENPMRQSWEACIATFAELMAVERNSKTLEEGPSLPIVSFQEWLQRLRLPEFASDDNAALKLEHFLTNDFERMAGGGVVLDTAVAQRDSATLAHSKALDRGHFAAYLAYWLK